LHKYVFYKNKEILKLKLKKKDEDVDKLFLKNIKNNFNKKIITWKDDLAK